MAIQDRPASAALRALPARKGLQDYQVTTAQTAIQDRRVRPALRALQVRLARKASLVRPFGCRLMMA